MSHYLHRLNQWHIFHIRWVPFNPEKRCLLSQFRQILSDMIVDLSFILHVWHKMFSIRVLHGAGQCTEHVMFPSRSFGCCRCQIKALLLFIFACFVGAFDGNHLPEVCDCIDGLNSLEVIQFNHCLVAIYGSSVETCLESSHQRCLVVQTRPHNFAPSAMRAFAESLSIFRVITRTFEPALRHARNTEPLCCREIPPLQLC
jgi:hypothetical protein